MPARGARLATSTLARLRSSTKTNELDWYDYLFKGVQNEFAQKPVRIFVMGLNQWRQEDDWPLARATNTKYFLHSQGAANSSGGNGSLSTDAPHSEPSDHYVYDPSNPVPTIGGPLCCDPALETRAA